MEILSVEPLTRAEVPKSHHRSAVSRIRDVHHRMAQLYAAGLKPRAIAEITGRSVVSVREWRRSPASEELVAQYREGIEGEITEVLGEQVKIITRARPIAWSQILDQLVEAEESGEPLPIRSLLAIAGDTSDRTGLGRQATQVNINVGIGAELEKRMRRAGSLMDRRAVVDVTPKLVRRG